MYPLSFYLFSDRLLSPFKIVEIYWHQRETAFSPIIEFDQLVLEFFMLYVTLYMLFTLLVSTKLFDLYGLTTLQVDFILDLQLILWLSILVERP